MADNVVADAGAGGSTFAAAELSFSGDTVIVPGNFVGLLSGSEGSWTFSLLVGGAGAVAAGVQRVTLASDDPAVTSLAIIDDWDESDRAKVNIIAGQAGVAAGAGAVGATVPRVTLASDDPAVALLGTIDTDTSTLAGAVAGTEMQVDVVGALPAGTNAIGKLASNAGVTIGAVEIAAAQTLATVTTVGTVTTCSTVTTVSTLTGGGVAHDSADSGNPHKIGAKASTALSGLTLVANADRTDLFAGIDGVQITRPHCNLEDIVTGLAAITDGSSTSVIASAGAGVKVYITEVIIANSSASNVTVDLRDGAAGSVKATFSAPATGGSHKTLSVPLPFSAATAVCADPSAAASTVTVTLIGFKSKV